MSEEDIKTKLIRHIETAIALVKAGKITYADEIPTAKCKINQNPNPRFIIPLSGQKPYKTLKNGKIKDFVLVTGEAVFIPAYCAYQPVWKKAHTMISIVYTRNYVRTLFIDNDGTHDQNGPDYWYHTSHGLEEAGLLLIRSLNIMTKNYKERPDQVHDIFSALLRETIWELEHDQPEEQGKALNTYYEVDEYLHNNFHLPISRDSICREFKITPSYLSRLYKRFGSESFHDCLNRLRMEKAAFLLKKFRTSVDETTLQCGFNDTGYFIKAFKKYYGITPGKFQC